MKFRPVRGGLEEAMREVQEWNNVEELRSIVYDHISPLYLIQNSLTDINGEIKPDEIKVEKYGQGIDERIGWDTHLVTIGGNPVGYTDGPIPKEQL